MGKPKKSLKIGQLAPLWLPVPPKKYGGIERIVYFLTEGLIKRGHKVTLFASGNSKTSAKLKFWRKNHLVKDKIPWRNYLLEIEHLAFSFSQAKNFDIFHCHFGPKGFPFLNFTDIPVLWTFHNPINPQENTPLFELIKRYKKKVFVNFLSKAQKIFCKIKFKNSFVVYNGVDLKTFKFNPKPKDYFLWVGRVEPYKGIENAIKIAKMANLKLLLVGKIDSEKKEYFEKRIRPELNEKVKYLGELPSKKLINLYQNSQATLYPIEWPEPFGLVMIESMACGTPVVVFDQGSAREIVNNGKTGFVVPFLNEKKEKNIKGFVETLKWIKEIKRENCRFWVEKNFSIERMVENYEKLYFKIYQKY